MRNNMIVILVAAYVTAMIGGRASGLVPEEIYDPVCVIAGLILFLLAYMLSRQSLPSSRIKRP